MRDCNLAHFIDFFYHVHNQDKIFCALSLFPVFLIDKKIEFVNGLYHPYSHPVLPFIANYYMLK